MRDKDTGKRLPPGLKKLSLFYF